ncbi:uncharacterized protein LOC122524541 [Polistes fuscatus]|uniref:uncharacterized protein LOC122524541 n=1 Tax=Polistes fuscatus TaxID=30207 RepID=UPI001CA8105A|nr:uncharacterized protein LOC122524541 [Polistes fuscatus]
MESTSSEINPCGRDTHTTAVFGGGRTGHPPSSSYDCHESAVGNPAQTLVNASGSCSQVGDLACELTKASGKEVQMEEWQKEARAMEQLRLTDPESPIKTRSNKRLRSIITSSDEDDCLIVEEDAPGRNQTPLTLEAGRLPEKLRAYLRGIEKERARCSNIKGEVSGRIKRLVKESLIIADVMEERMEKQSGSRFSRAEAIYQLRTEAKIRDEQIRQMEGEIARLQRELKKREAEKQCHGVKAIATPNQGRQAPTINKVTPSLEKRLEDARIGDDMSCVTAVLRDFSKSIEALQKTQLEMWKVIRETNKPPQRETGGTAVGGKGSAPAPGTSRAPAQRVPVVSNAVPPSQDGFVEVVGRKKRRQQTKPTVGQEKTTTSGDRGATGSGTKKKKKKKKKKNRNGGTRETAAVSLACNETLSYRDALAKARESISLKEFGVEKVTMRRGLTGAFIFSIRGKEAAIKADRVADALKRTVPEAKIARPHRSRSFRLVGIDPSLNMTVIRNALLAIKGNIDPNKIWVGEIRAGRGRLWETVVSAPVEMAQAVINRGGVDFGLYRAKVVELRQRPLRCHRCLARGHVAMSCPSSISRANLCHQCGQPGHNAKDCRNKIECPVCRDAGHRNRSHRAGSWECPVVPPRRVNNEARASAGSEARVPSVSTGEEGMEVDADLSTLTGTLNDKAAQGKGCDRNRCAGPAEVAGVSGVNTNNVPCPQ